MVPAAPRRPGRSANGASPARRAAGMVVLAVAIVMAWVGAFLTTSVYFVFVGAPLLIVGLIGMWFGDRLVRPADPPDAGRAT